VLRNPPLIPTDLTPQEIIGSGNLASFTEHCKLFWQRASDGKVIHENAQMGAILNNLIKHGYRVAGLDAYGNLAFSVVTMSRVQQKFIGPEFDKINRLSQKEQRDQARKGYSSIADNEAWRTVTPQQIADERYTF